MEEEKKPKSLLVIHNATIVTVDQESRVFSDGGIVVDGDTIKAIGRSTEILHQYSPLADEVVDLQRRILLPGFVNTHVHTSQQLARGIADDVELMTWLHERIWPYESSMTEDDSYVSTLLCGVELIRSGADMVIVNPFLWTMVPLHDCIANLVYCMRTENIESVMCNGRWILKNRKIVNVNEVPIPNQALFAAAIQNSSHPPPD
ncbi:hypothetical protein QJS10_CPA06g01686 [Acorus calamus]|uniref:Amidohydrolase-related domain-containing protein n=1 Tax=Acorus calamus TaxID=4465 RepID=A0AAV9EMR4_ACOCL|nr:hypothetical protein QJS10_CPA06g01686 [Acorus calamus]